MRAPPVELLQRLLEIMDRYRARQTEARRQTKVISSKKKAKPALGGFAV